MGRKAGLGKAESEILRYIVEKHPVTVRTVAEQFSQVRKTTVQNVMERLRAKGFLARELTEGTFHYSPTQSREPLMRGLVAEFVDSMLGGSVEPLAVYLSERESFTEAELARLKALIEKLEEGQ